MKRITFFILFLLGTTLACGGGVDSPSRVAQAELALGEGLPPTYTPKPNTVGGYMVAQPGGYVNGDAFRCSRCNTNSCQCVPANVYFDSKTYKAVRSRKEDTPCATIPHSLKPFEMKST